MDLNKYNKGENKGGVVKVHFFCSYDIQDWNSIYSPKENLTSAEHKEALLKVKDADFLKMALDYRLANEDFEIAALIRDRIKELEK